jgi:hypothetical protein
MALARVAFLAEVSNVNARGLYEGVGFRFRFTGVGLRKMFPFYQGYGSQIIRQAFGLSDG